MLYDVLKLEESWAFIRLIMAVSLIGLYAVFFYKIKKRILSYKIKPLIAFVSVFTFGLTISYFGVTDSNNDLKELKKQYQSGRFSTVQGELKIDIYQNDGFDRYSIDKKQFLRVDPHKAIPKFGCWTEFVAKNPQLNGKSVIMDYIVFTNYINLPKHLSDKPLDQICVLKFEVLK